MVRYSSVEDFLPRWLSATPVAGPIGALSAEERTRLVATVRERLGDYVDDDGLAAPSEAHVALAIR